MQFPSIHEHISTYFTNLDNGFPRISSLPGSQLRGTLDDFLSNPDRFLSPSKGGDDIHVTLYDVERAIGEDLDDWVARVTDIDKACEQLERLVHRYLSLAQGIYWDFSERYDEPTPPPEFLPRGRSPSSPLQTPPYPSPSRPSSPPSEIFSRSHSPPPPLEILSCRRSLSPILEILPLGRRLPPRSEVFPRDRSPSPPLDILPLGRSLSLRLQIFTPQHRRPLCHRPHSLRSSSPFLCCRSPSPSSEILPGCSPSPPLGIFPRGGSPYPPLEISPHCRPLSPLLSPPLPPLFEISPSPFPPIIASFPYTPHLHELLPFPVTIDPRNCSMMLLAIIELWVALDKLVLKELPILVQYSPEVPLYLLYGLLLHDAASIDRFCRAQQYIAVRHTQARRGWSVLSNIFTKDSFPCRYYDKHLQHLKVEGELLLDPLHAKVILFELQCPVAFDKWRSVTCLLSRIKPDLKRDGDIKVSQIPALGPHVPTDFKRSLLLFYFVGPCILCLRRPLYG